MKTAARIFSLFAILLFSHQAQSQGRPPEVDTLLQKLSRAKEDTSRALILLRIGEAFTRANMDSAIKYLEQGNKLSIREHYDRGLFEYYSDYGDILNAQGKYQQSLEYNMKSLPVVQKINKPYSGYGLAAWHGNIAICYDALGIYDSCVSHCMAALKIFEDNDDKERAALLNSNLISIYSSMTLYNKALESGRKAIKICRENNYTPILQNALVNTGGAYAKLRKYDSALIMLREVEAMARKNNDVMGVGQALITINYVLIATNQFADVKKNAEEIITITKAIGDEGARASAVLSLARYYLHQKDYVQARDSANSALGVGLKNNLKEGIVEAYLLLSDIELASGNLSSYSRYRDMSDSIRDVILSDQIEKNSQEFEVKYSLSKKQAEIAQLTREQKIQALELRQKNIIAACLVGLLLAILLVAFSYYRNYNQKKKLLMADAELSRQKVVQLEQEKQLSATQSVLQGQEEERTRLAKDLHDGLGGMLSGIKFSFSNMKDNLIMTPENQQSFERSMDMLDTSIRELRRVAHNMMPESLIKFGLDAALNDQCNYINQSGILKATYQSVGVKDASIEKKISVNVYRIVQELLNNVMKHAVATEVLVQLIIEGSRFSITVEDNGKGFNTSEVERKDGIGWTNIRNRVDYLNGKMDVQSSPEKGTSVFIEFNV